MCDMHVTRIMRSLTFVFIDAIQKAAPRKIVFSQTRDARNYSQSVLDNGSKNYPVMDTHD
jgi:hypothetical protein